MYTRQDRKIKDTLGNKASALWYHGYEYEEIAEIMGRNKKSVYTLCYRNVDKSVKVKDSPTPYIYMSKEEQELLEEYKEKIEEVSSRKIKELRGKKASKKKQKSKKDSKKKDNTKAKTKEKTKEKVGTKKEEKKKRYNEKKTKPVENTIGKVTSIEETVQQEIKQTLGEKRQSNISTKAESYDEYLERETQYDLISETGECKLCGGVGWVMRPTDKGLRKIVCPSCMGVKTKDTSNMTEVEKEQKLEKLIPNPYYRENNYDHEKFEEGVGLPERLRGRSFARYQDFMDEVLIGLEEKIKPKNSYFVVAPDNYGKKWFGYEMIKLMVKNGMKTKGYIDLLKAHRALYSKDYNELEEMLSSEIIMISITGLARDKYASIVRYILEYADSRGIPVFMFSRVTASMFVQGDRGLTTVFSNNLRPHDYGRMMEVGLQGREFREAYRILEEESMDSIGYKEESN